MATFSLVPVDNQPRAAQAQTFSLVPVDAAPTIDTSTMGAAELKQLVESGQITPEQAAQQVKNVAGNPDVLNAPEPKQGTIDALAGAGANLASGYTFGLADEASAALAAPIVAAGGGMGLGEAYNQSLAEARKLQGQFSKENPVTSGALNIAGAVANPLNRSILSGAALKNSLTLGGAVQNAVTGAASGALYGAGNAEGGLGERIAGATEGAGSGALLGAALPAGLNVAGKAMTGVAVPAAKVAKNLIIGRDADKVFSEIISRSKLTPDQIKAGVTAGKISTIADIAGDEVQGLTRSVGKMQGAKDIVADALNNRSDTAVSRVVGELTKNISNVDTYFGNLDDIAKARSAVAEPLYKKAYADGANIPTEKIAKFINDKRVQDAIAEAKKSYGVRLEAPNNSLEVLDGAKKVLDDQIGVAVRAGESNKVRVLSDFKNQFVSALDEAVPSYKNPRRVFSGFAKLQEAQESGLAFKRSTPEQIRMQLKDMTPDQREAYRIGVRASLQREVAQTSTGADPAKRIFGNQFEREQLEAVLGKGKQFNDFAKRMQEEIRAADTKFKVLGGSRTDINLGSDSELGSLVTQLGTQGVKNTIFSRGVEYVGEKIQQRYYGISKTNAEALARALTDRKGGLEALDRLIAKQTGPQKAIVSQAVQGLRTFSTQLQDPNTPVGGAVQGVKKTLGNQRGKLEGGPAAIAGAGLAGLGLSSMFNNGSTIDRNVQQMGGESIMPSGYKERAAPTYSAPVSKTVIMDEEGFEPRVYNDTVGKKTVGYGFNMSQPNASSIWARAGIPERFSDVLGGRAEVSDASAQRLLDYVHRRADSAVDKIAPFAANLGENQRAALTSMVYQMGAKGVQDFKKMLAYLKDGNSKAVENQLLASKFARQTPARAKRTALMLAYNMSPQEAEQALVQAGRIQPNERKYQDTPPQQVEQPVAAPKRMRYADAKESMGIEDV